MGAPSLPRPLAPVRRPGRQASSYDVAGAIAQELAVPYDDTELDVDLRTLIEKAPAGVRRGVSRDSAPTLPRPTPIAPSPRAIAPSPPAVAPRKPARRPPPLPARAKGKPSAPPKKRVLEPVQSVEFSLAHLVRGGALPEPPKAKSPPPLPAKKPIAPAKTPPISPWSMSERLLSDPPLSAFVCPTFVPPPLLPSISRRGKQLLGIIATGALLAITGFAVATMGDDPAPKRAVAVVAPPPRSPVAIAAANEPPPRAVDPPKAALATPIPDPEPEPESMVRDPPPPPPVAKPAARVAANVASSVRPSAPKIAAAPRPAPPPPAPKFTRLSAQDDGGFTRLPRDDEDDLRRAPIASRP